MPGERVYPVHNLDTVARMQQAFTEKVNANREAGRRAFQSGEYKPFTGFAKEGFHDLFAMGLELDQASQGSIITQVSEPMSQIAEELGVPAIFAGKGDLLPHVTVFNSPFKGVPTEDQEKILAYLQSDVSHLGLLSKILSGLTFHMNELVVAPASYLCQSEFTDEQGAPFKARQLSEEIIKRAIRSFEREEQIALPGTFGFPYRWDNIFHASVARITDAVDPDRLLSFADKVDHEIGQPLRDNPIAITVA
ncbi:MAG TPA: hypothetical protein VG935_01900 [Patescibacteria group bacterium]|nr:hypothetical protein [Patescibacteria group bacterium]